MTTSATSPQARFHEPPRNSMMDNDTSLDSPVTAEVPQGDFAALLAERDALRAERAELNDRLLRRQAEFENFRRRVERERADTAEYAGAETVKSLLTVLDDFERALTMTTPDSAHSEAFKGMRLIFQRMQETLKKQGLEPVEAVGKPFDPHLHEAIERVETSEAADQEVLGEFQRGYLYKGKLLRPAMVRVAVRA